MTDPHGNRRCPVCGNADVTMFLYDGAYATVTHYRCNMAHCQTTWKDVIEHPFNLTEMHYEPVIAR